jgi:uroporphyrinogen decarboxylase
LTDFENDNFLRACWKKETEFTPIWFMRQAGRYLESYRRVRAKNDVLTICKTPELAAKVTVDAATELGVDAAIIFADIMLPLEGIGQRFKLVDSVGPVVEKPIERMEDVKTIGKFSPKDHVPFVTDAIELVIQQLDGREPLIGFSGAPFTLASYLIEGSPSREFTKTKMMMYSEPEAWKLLMAKLSGMVSDYLLAQIRAGVDAVQLFDSWSGCLSPSDYQEFVLPFNKQIFDRLKPEGVPRIHFGVGTAGILKAMREAGGDIFGVDWRISIDEAWAILGHVAIQGNLDPAILLGANELVQARSKDILARIGGRPGHIFNLGHGVLPDTPPEHVKSLVRFIHGTTGTKR